MIPNEGWHYLAVDKISALLKGITSKHDGDFYCLNCLKNKGFCGTVIPLEKDNMLDFNQYMKPDKYIIYADMEPLIKKCMDAQIIEKILE